MHKNPSSNCQSCADKFLGCDPRIVTFVKGVQEVFPDCHMAVGFRDQADQHMAKVSGKSAEDWPDSKHNVTLEGHPCSKAVDLFMLAPDWKAYFLVPYYKAIWDWYLKNEDKFESKYRWGGTFHTLHDYDHFEIVE